MLPSSNTYAAINYGNNNYVILSTGSSRIVYSTDLVNWTETIGLSLNCTDLAFGNNNFVAIGTGSVSLTSTNGTTWTQRSINNNNWNNVIFNV